MKELSTFRKHLNEGSEPKSEYKIRAYESSTTFRYIDITIDEDLINELRDEDNMFDDTWEEVQEQIKNDQFEDSEIFFALLDEGYEPEEDNGNLESGVNIL